MRRLLIFSAFALVGTGFWFFYHEGLKLDKDLSSAHKKSQIDTSLADEEVDFSGHVLDYPSPDTSGLYLLIQDQDFMEWSRKAEFREVKNIHPPIKGVNPPSSATLLTPEIIEKGGRINLGFDASLHLPANALVDEDGMPVNEAVKISYCPLSDPIDVFLSGVPMKYDSAGRSETFRTAGMVRLEATTYSGKQVSLKNGQSMRLDMPTIDKADDYNFYTFDESAGKWTFSSIAYPARTYQDLVQDIAKTNYPFDTTSFANKFDDLRYHYLMKQESNKLERGSWYNRTEINGLDNLAHSMFTDKYWQTNRIKLYPFTVQNGKDEKGRAKKEVRFTLKSAPGQEREFEELRNFAGFQFVAEDVINLQEFYRIFPRGKQFSDVRIAYNEGEEYCTLYLKSNEEIITLKASVSRIGPSRIKEKCLQLFANGYYRYLQVLGIKQKNHDAIIQANKTRYDQENTNSSSSLTNYATNYYRQLSLPGFATYNVDQIVAMKNPQPIAKKFLLADGREIVPDEVVVCDLKVRASFTFSRGMQQAQCSENGFGFALIHKAGEVYYLTKKAFEEQSKNSSRLIKPLPKIEEGSDLRKLLLGEDT